MRDMHVEGVRLRRGLRTRVTIPGDRGADRIVRPVGILEMVRTGAVAMLRGTEADQAGAPAPDRTFQIVAA